MDANYSRKKERGKITLNRAVLLKASGPKSIGFQGFKIVNSNIKIVKQVEVRNPIRPKQTVDTKLPKKPTVQYSVSVEHTENNEKKNNNSTNDASHSVQSNVDTLKEIRERIQAKKKNQEMLHADLANSSLTQNGTLSDSSSTSKVEKRQQMPLSKHSDATEKPKLKNSHDCDPVIDRKSSLIITDDLLESFNKHSSEQDHRDDCQSSPYHKNKSMSAVADDKRKDSTPNNENRNKRKSDKVYSNSRSRGHDLGLKNDGHRKRHDRHNESHRKSKRDSDNRDNYERISNLGSECSSSTHDKNYNHGGYRDVKDYDQNEYHSKSSHQKYSKSRKRSERSKSPHWEKEHRHHGKGRFSSEEKFYPPERSKSPYRDKDRDAYYSKSRTSEWESGHHEKEYSSATSHSRSKLKHRMYARKYSAPRDDRDTKYEPSHSRSRKSDSGHDSRSNHIHSDSQREGRSSKSQRRISDNISSQQKHSGRDGSGYKDGHGRHERKHDEKFHDSPPLVSKDISACGNDKKGLASEKDKKRTKIDGSLFSKLSIAFSLDGEDEDYEVEISGSEHDSSKVEADSHEEDGDKPESDLESSHDRAISGNCEQTNASAKKFYHRDSMCDDAAPMLVVDEVKTDSSEYELFDDRHDPNNMIYGSDPDRCPNNGRSGKFHVSNTVIKENVVSSSLREGVETMSSIPCTEGSWDNEPESNSIDRDLDYSLSSPPTPLMDEPQDNVLLMSRANTEQQVPKDAVAHSSSTLFRYSEVQDSCSNNEAPLKPFAISSTFNNSSSSQNISVAGDPEKDIIQSLCQVGSDERLTISSEYIKNMQSEVVCTYPDTSSSFRMQDHVPASGMVTSSISTRHLISTASLSSGTTSACSVKTENAVSGTNIQPIQSRLFKQNKLPNITSQLQSVYKSLLETNFQANDVDKQSESTNGLIPQEENQLDAVESDQESFLSGHAVKNLSHNLTPAEPEQLQNKDSDMLNKKFHIESNQVIASVESAVEQVLVEAVSSVSSSVVQDTSVKMSPHKLKLHATTKTPLPAKKSYIQQVHPRVKIREEKMQPTSTNHATNVLTSESDPANTSILVCDNELNKNDQVQSVTNCDETSDHVENCPDELKISLSRQDSGSSGGNDNDEGPRRSARIRTKKSERSLKKQSSVDANPGQIDCTTPSIDINTDNPEPVPETTKYADRNIFECSLKELSEEEIFKIKICLTPGISDCPEIFHLLEENLYLTSVKKSRARKEIKRMVCDCGLDDSTETDDPCGENCLNRLLMIECSSRCLYGHKCSNKRFQMRKYAPTEVFKTDFKGWGIRAADDIEPGELVMEYCGEVVDQREFTRRSLEYSKSNHAHFYFMALSQDEVIDATYKGNASRFINHSCDPNAETQKWTVNGRLRVGFFTVKSIKKGDEITFDYQFERYGKIAQKCYCGTAKCRGYLGKAPDENEESETKFSRLLSSDAILDNDDLPEKVRKKRKISIFQDDMMEKDISRLKNGLQSTKDVLTLSRLMVRCDTYTHRSMCLQVLKDTACQTRLKNFLKFHGLSIIWSWMVDITSADNNEATSFKMDIINTLCILPISNKNIIEDSKVLPVVQRWAKPDSDDKSDETVMKVDELKVEKHTDSDSLEQNDTAATSERPTDDGTVNDTVSPEDTSSKAEVDEGEVDEGASPTKTPSAGDEKTEESEDISAEKIIEAAAKLLDSWKDLKEIYRIPKRQRPLPSPSQDSNSRTSSPAPKQSKTDEYDVKISRTSLNAWRDNSLERWKDFNERSAEGKFKDNQASPGSNTSSENKREPTRRKRRFSTDSDDGTVPWHCKPPRSMKMSREEHRRRFEQGVEKREQEKRRLEEMEAEMARSAMMNSQHQYMMEEMPPMVGPDVAMMAPGTTFTQGGVSGNLIQINPAPVMIDQFGQQVDMLSPMIQQNLYDPQIPMQQSYGVHQNMQGMFNPEMGVQQGFQGQQVFQDGYSLQATSAQAGVPMTGMNQQQMVGNSFGIGNPQTVSMEMQHIAQPPLPTVQQPQQPMNNVTILGTQNGQAIVMLSAEQLQKLTQGDLPSVTSKSENAESTKKTDDSTKESTDADGVPKQLPPNWKTATDPDGRVYYYHDITRETQWDPPKWKETPPEKGDKASPKDGEKQSKDKNKRDKITDEGRKAKDQFRLKMSQFVVQCLSSFRKPDKKVGRITSTEDFKHLARKLTHIIMQKELRQVQVLEDLDFNANVKHKTKEYVKKYMSKVGPVYRIKDDT